MGKGILEVKLVDAKGLQDTDAKGLKIDGFSGKMDPYVVVQYGKEKRKTRVARGQGTNPTWNETLKFKVQHSDQANSEHKLILRIMDKDSFTRDDFVGQAMIDVGEAISLGFQRGKGKLHVCKHRVILADQTYCGDIRVGVTFTPKELVKTYEHVIITHEVGGRDKEGAEDDEGAEEGAEDEENAEDEEVDEEGAEDEENAEDEEVDEENAEDEEGAEDSNGLVSFFESIIDSL